MIEMTDAARQNVDECNVDVALDVFLVRIGGRLAASALIAKCMDGADRDRIPGWREYIDAVCDAAGVHL